MFKAVVSRFIQMYKPEFIINQFGVDGYYQDPLVGLSLSTNTYKEVARMIHDLANRYSNGNLSIPVGGGHNTRNSVRCRSVMFAIIAEDLPKKIQEYHRLVDKKIYHENGKILNDVKRVVQTNTEMIFPFYGIDNDSEDLPPR